MALNLVEPAITVWNTAYLEQAVRALEEAGVPIPTRISTSHLPTGLEAHHSDRHLALGGRAESVGSLPTPSPGRHRASTGSGHNAADFYSNVLHAMLVRSDRK
jgi:hypothetical protein